MIIRSQDKMTIVNLDNILCLRVNKVVRPSQFLECGDVKIVCLDGVGEIGLGWYSSEEKAIKVLDMMEDEYRNGNEWLCVSGKVFKMPQENEV